jgi:hypothetical protein
VSDNLETLREMVAALHGAESVYWERRLDALALQVEEAVQAELARKTPPDRQP